MPDYKLTEHHRESIQNAVRNVMNVNRRNLYRRSPFTPQQFQDQLCAPDLLATLRNITQRAEVIKELFVSSVTVGFRGTPTLGLTRGAIVGFRLGTAIFSEKDICKSNWWNYDAQPHGRFWFDPTKLTEAHIAWLNRVVRASRVYGLADDTMKTVLSHTQTFAQLQAIWPELLVYTSEKKEGNEKRRRGYSVKQRTSQVSSTRSHVLKRHLATVADGEFAKPEWQQRIAAINTELAKQHVMFDACNGVVEDLNLGPESTAAMDGVRTEVLPGQNH